jgi:hypothetical protein
MYDVNPLGPLMHLKELDRQAAVRLRPLRSRRQDASRVTAVTALMIALLQRLPAVFIAGRVARQG